MFNNMTDSEEDVLSSNVFTYPNDRLLITAKGPNNTNISTYSCRSNFLTSTMYPPRNFERRTLNYDQRSLYYKRDTSPMSLRSVPNFIPRNYPQPASVGSATFQRSIINGRSCSPTSVRSTGTNVSMSGTEIASAINNEAFHMNDIRVIKEAIDKLYKKRFRKRVEKRRNRKLLLMSKRKSGNDSGEEGSDSSFSNDDCRSIRTAPCVANHTKYKSKFNVSTFKMTNKENYMYTNRTEDMKRKSLRNMISSDRPPEKTLEKGLLLKNRFQNGFSLPSQRFNKISMEPQSSQLSNLNHCNAQSVQMVNAKQKVNTNETRKNNLSEEMDSEQEEIFSEITTIEKNCEISSSNKRTIELDESNYNPHKKSKVASMQIQETSKDIHCLQNDVASEFVFAKPQMPLRKLGNTKKTFQSPEKIISKSRQPLFDIAENSDAIISPPKGSKTPDEIEFIEKGNNDIASIRPAPSSDLSMQPSFIKRKLFTQKLDVAEKRNISDSSLSSSPQVKNLSGIKEKTKARKLASSQSCLSRDVLGEDNNNFLDLLHKIVPAEKMNVTNSTNKTACQRNSQRDSNDKWDITSVISACLENDISDTYTDEEIFKVENHCSNKSKSCGNIEMKNKSISNCKVVLEKLPLVQQTKEASDISHKQIPNTTTKDTDKIGKKVKSFWDTDTESELETELKNYASLSNLNYLLKINDTVDNSIDAAKRSKKVQDQKTESMSIETKGKEARNKTQKKTNKRNVPSAETKNATKNNKRKFSPEAKENNNNLNTSYSSDKNTQKKDLADACKKVTLIGHRIGNPKRQIRSKRINTIESPPDDLDISINVKGKPTETCNTSALSQKIGNSKRQIRSKKINTIGTPQKQSNISINGIEKPTETCKMGNPKRQVKPKTTNTVEPPQKNSNISNKEKGTPPKITKVTTLNHTTSRCKSQVKSKTNYPVELFSPQSTDNSDLNISIKSLRSYKKRK